MKNKKTSLATRVFKDSLATPPMARFILRLYVAGATDRSRQALLRVRQLCESQLKGNYELEVIDVYQQPVLTREGQIVATPTLVRTSPAPVRRLIGNLANLATLFAGLE